MDLRSRYEPAIRVLHQAEQRVRASHVAGCPQAQGRFLLRYANAKLGRWRIARVARGDYHVAVSPPGIGAGKLDVAAHQPVAVRSARAAQGRVVLRFVRTGRSDLQVDDSRDGTV